MPNSASRWRLSGAACVMLVVCALAGRWASACGEPPPKNWDACYPITVVMNAPSDESLVAGGSNVTCTASTIDSVDWDRWTQGGGGYYEKDSLSYKWTATRGGSPVGSFSNNGEGASVTWTAPDSAGDVTITCTADDPSGPHVPPGDTGTRQDDPPGSDSVTVKVIWVTISMKSSSAQSVAADNARRDTYYYATSPHAYNLGQRQFTGAMGWGCEFTGTVSPSSFTGSITLERDAEGRTYKGLNGDQLDESQNYSASIPPGNDTSHDPWRDDDPQSGSSTGQIYDLDAPGTWTIFDDAANTIRRERANFEAFAVYGGKRCSAIFEWYTKQSYKKTGASTTGTCTGGQTDSGTATGGTASTLTDGTKSWTVNEWQDGYVIITAGTGAVQLRQISSNTATTLSVSADWTTAPDDTSEYSIIGPTAWHTLRDTSKSWTTDAWQNGSVCITAGTGIGQCRGVSSNTATILTVTPDWDVIPDTTSQYLLSGPSTWTVVSDVENDNATGQGQLSKLTWNLQ